MAAMMYDHIDPETTAVLDPAAVGLQPVPECRCRPAPGRCTTPSPGRRKPRTCTTPWTVRSTSCSRVSTSTSAPMEDRHDGPPAGYPQERLPAAGAVQHPRHRPGLAAQHGRRVCHLRRRAASATIRSRSPSVKSYNGSGQRPHSGSQNTPGKRVIPTWAADRDELDPEGQRHLRRGALHRRRRATSGRTRGRGQDRHGREPPGRMVLRLHAGAHHLRVDGLPRGRLGCLLDDPRGRQRRTRSAAVIPPRSGTTS